MMGWGVAGLSGLLSVASPQAAVRETSPQPLKAASPPPPTPLPPKVQSPPNAAPPANVMFLVDTNESMQDFAQYLPEDFTPGFYPASSTTATGRRGYVGAQEGDFINTGCTDPALVAAMSWFDPNSTDPGKNGSTAYDTDPDLGSSLFQPDQFYHARGRRIAWETEDYPYSLSADFKSTLPSQSALSACYQVVNWNVSDYYSASTELMDECQVCLTTKGWWRGPRITSTTGMPFADWDYPSNRTTQTTGQPPTPDAAYRKWVVSGRVLNVRPPKFVVARKALKDIIGSANNVRMGVASFGGDHGWFDPPWVLADMSPSCDKSSPTVDEQALNRTQLAHAVNNVRFGNPDRATGESLFGLGGYFSSQVQDNKWSNWFSNPINPGYFGWPGCCDGGTYDEPPGTPGHTGASYGARTPDEWTKGTENVSGTSLPGQPWEPAGSNSHSVCFADQKTAIILVTGGTPRYDNVVPITRMMEILKAHGARHADGSLVQFDPTDPESNPNVGGINYCDQVVKNPITGAKYTKTDCDYGPESYNWPVGLGVGNKNFMDDVSFFLAHTDLRGDLPGDQTVRTYVVGYGDNSPMNQSIAIAGQGHFYPAANGDQLRSALLNALGDLSSAP